MKTSEIRKAFLEYFTDKDHVAVVSSSLVPHGDPTLLFTNAGMVPFKDCFLGLENRGFVRATSCQKSLRISGKHNDLENVGRTARHHTFFEMLGNFSFGDYFKSDAIKYAWEFLTVVLALPKDRLWVTVYEEDDEAARLWASLTDVPKERILRCGKEDNFWAMGETGPCGPCSEIHYYLGNDLSLQSEADFRIGDGRYLEVWNLVFMQFNREPSGKLQALPKPSVDTGMGLERIAAIKQGVFSNYDNDLFAALITKTEKLSKQQYVGKDYTAHKELTYKTDVAFRVIADHARAVAFLLADGVMPASDGRGYVLRRLVRRACRHGRELGFKKAFLFEVVSEVIEIMGNSYPELIQGQNKILSSTKNEEEKFLDTLETGLEIFESEITRALNLSSTIFSGKTAFLLHDTYGFPLDLTADLSRERGLKVDVQVFEEEMQKQKERSRAARAGSRDIQLQQAVAPLNTEFVGYDFEEYESQVLGLFSAGGAVSSAKAGEEIALVVEQTPFYAESGGQIGDSGVITANSGVLTVLDTQKVHGSTIVHICRVEDGVIALGERVRLTIEGLRRQKIRLNHTATHLLHAGLRHVLGTGIRQAGSRVSEKNLRFDFTHQSPLDEFQLRDVNTFVNELVRKNSSVRTDLMPLEQAKKSGAMALFGEKYGATVRVVSVGEDSLELCGGTHALRAGDIGFFSLVSQSSVASGVRRIEALSGASAVDYSFERRTLLNGVAQVLHSSEVDVLGKLKTLLDRNRELEAQLGAAKNATMQKSGSELTSKAFVNSQGIKVLAASIEEASAQQLRQIADELKITLGSGCIALASVVEGKAVLLTAVTDDLTTKYHAGKLVQNLSALIGGKGGGRADMAQAGGGDPARIPEALKHFESLTQ